MATCRQILLSPDSTPAQRAGALSQIERSVEKLQARIKELEQQVADLESDIEELKEYDD